MDFKRTITLKASFWITKPIDTDFSSLLPVSAYMLISRTLLILLDSRWIKLFPVRSIYS